MKLFIEPLMDNMGEELKGHTNWSLFLRPSLVLFFRYTWMEGRKDFWDILSNLEASSVLFIHKMPSYLVIASESASMVDLQPLLEVSRWPDRIRLIQGLVATAQHYCLNKLFRRATGDWWLEFALRLINTGEESLIHTGGVVLYCAADELRALSDAQRSMLNRGSVDLIRYYLQPHKVDKRVATPLIWLCKTIESDPQTSVSLIRNVLSRDQIQQYGYILAPPIADQINDIWGYDPALAVTVYGAIFSYRESDRSQTSFNDSRILRLTSTRSTTTRWPDTAFAAAFQIF